jgi:hypothetical protein
MSWRRRPNKILAVADAPTPTTASLLEYVHRIARQSRSRVQTPQARELALRWFPNSPPLLWRFAQRAFQAGAFGAAADLLDRLLDLGRTAAYDRASAFDPALMSELALLNLGNCCIRLDDLDRAERCFGPLLANPAYQAQARQGHASVQKLRQRPLIP